jgi:hypothetical protein
MSRDERNALLTAARIAEAVTEVVNETPEGAPSGLIYASLMNLIRLEEYETTMRLLVLAKRITRRGDLYFPAAH